MSSERPNRGLNNLLMLVFVVVAGVQWFSGASIWIAFAFGCVLVIGRNIYFARRRAAPNLRPEQLANALVLGQDVDGGGPVVLSDEQLAAHGVILGATGSGKTTSLLVVLIDAIRRGRAVVAIDLKGSPAVELALHQAAERAGRGFARWSPDGGCHWNPLRYGDATELKDKLISTERWSEPHYQRAAERYVQTAIQVLQAAAPDRPVTLAAVVALLDPQRLQGMLVHLPREMVQRVGPYLSSLNRDQKSAILGLQSRLAVITESTPGAFLQPGERELDLCQALAQGGEVVLFSLNSSRFGKLAAQIAALAIQDLVAIAGHRLTAPGRELAFVAIDEFSSLDADNLLALLAKARESAISVLLSTQELADLDRAGPGFRDQVLGNTAITIAHRQNVPASAELIARMIGTKTVWQRTYQTDERGLTGHFLGERNTGLGTKREVEQFRIHPNQIKDLPTGLAVVITKLPTASARIVRIRNPWQETSDGN